MVHLTEHPHLCHTLPLELLITVKPPAPRERHDCPLVHPKPKLAGPLSVAQRAEEGPDIFG